MRSASLIRRCLTRPSTTLLGMCAGLAALWMGLGLTFFLHISHLTQQWDQKLAHTTLIVLPTDHPHDLQPLLNDLSHLQGISTLHALSSKDVNDLLTQWGAPWPPPVPAIIALTGDVETSSLKHLSTSFSSDSTIITPPPPSAEQRSFTPTLRKNATIITAMVSLSANAFFLISLFLIWRSTRLAQQSSFVLLHQLGCPLHRGYYTFVYRFAFASFTGSIVGVFFLLPLLYIMSCSLSPLVHQTPPTSLIAFCLSLGSSIKPLCVLPFTYALFGGGMSWLCYRSTLRNLS